MHSPAMRNRSRVVTLGNRPRSLERHAGVGHRQMRISVTGGTGFIGGALVRRLLGQRMEVRVLARESRRADALEAQGAELVRADLADRAAIERVIEGADTVYHAAGKVSGADTREEFFEANVNGTERLLEACQRQGVRRVVYLSSIAVYGRANRGETIDEHTLLDPNAGGRDYYSQSKIAADRLAGSFAAQNRLAVAILRPGIVYGPGRPLPVGLLGFRAGRFNFVFGSSGLHFPLTYIENLIDAMLLSASAARDVTREYIVLDDEELTLGAYHQTKSKADKTRTIFLPRWPVLLGGPLGGMPRDQIRRALEDRRYRARRIREEIGWAPAIGLPESIAQTLERSC
jgi:nucleoside-diphosphate-sugar epimerase